MTIIGFSSSPFRGGNVDRMVNALLEMSKRDTIFTNLHDLEYGPCLGCAHLCASDNLCKLEDDLMPLYHKIIEAEAIVLGTPSFFSSMNSVMAMFLERLWSLRHNRFPLEGKPFVVVSSGAFSVPTGPIEAVKRRMTAYRAKYVGGVGFLSRIAPCFSCGDGLTCRVGSLYRVYSEEGLERLRKGENLFEKWEDSASTVKAIEELGDKLSRV
ncbi:MAG: flavodoxin family protein [Candidatus Bathyarchaeota archaeon]|nr:flavodoxin family protein [Candidatus Bathyarchaeota archaeon]